MATIVPAILAHSVATLTSQLAEADQWATEVHLDVADGEFVPNTTLALADILEVSTALPRELHLMVANPRGFIEQALPHHPARILVHLNAIDDLGHFIHDAARYQWPIGYVIDPSTDLELIRPHLLHMNYLMVMDIQPGFQGQAFLPDTYDRIETWHNACPTATLAVDGGVDVDHVPLLVQHHVDRLVVGSAIWEDPTPRAAYARLVAVLTQP